MAPFDCGDVATSETSQHYNDITRITLENGFAKRSAQPSLEIKATRIPIVPVLKFNKTKGHPIWDSHKWPFFICKQ